MGRRGRLPMVLDELLVRVRGLEVPLEESALPLSQAGQRAASCGSTSLTVRQGSIRS